MKFDKLFSSFLEEFKSVDEMAIHLYNTDPIIDPETGLPAKHSPRNKPELHAGKGNKEIGVDTPEEKEVKIKRFKDAFVKILSARTKGGNSTYDLDALARAVRTAAASATVELPPGITRPHSVYVKFVDKLVDLFFPEGVNDASDWESFADKGSPLIGTIAQAFQEVTDEYSDILGVKVPITFGKKSEQVYFARLIKNAIIDTGVTLSNINGADYLSSGTKSSRGREDAATKARTAAEPAFTKYQESLVQESPVSIHASPGKYEDVFKKAMRDTFVDKHSSINDETNNRGSTTHHVGDLAKHLSGSPTHSETPTASVSQASDIFADVIYKIMFDEHGKNPSMNHNEFRQQMKGAVEKAIEELESQHGVDIFSTINNLPKYTARIIDRGLEDLFVTKRRGADGTTKTWKVGKLQEQDERSKLPEDEDEDDEEDNDIEDDTEEDSSDFAYEQGLLSDEENEDSTEDDSDDEEAEEETSDEDVEASADNETEQIEKIGIDIAHRFLQALDELELEDSEEDDETELEDEDDEDVRSYISRGRAEDDEENLGMWDRDQDQDDNY